MIFVWWNIDVMLHFKFVSDGHAVYAHLYSEKQHRDFKVSRTSYFFGQPKRVLIQHDNATAHRALLTQAAIKEIE